MADKRRLAYGEQRGALFSSEKGRDRADARRQIEALQQGDQQIAAQQRQAGHLAEQTQMFRYMCDRLVAIERLLIDLNEKADGKTRSTPVPPPPPA